MKRPLFAVLLMAPVLLVSACHAGYHNILPASGAQGTQSARGGSLEPLDVTEKPTWIISVGQDGKVSANNNQARSMVRKWTKVDENLFISDNGERAAFPGEVPIPGFRQSKTPLGVIGAPPAVTATGPYQRLYLQAGAAYVPVTGSSVLWTPPNGVLFHTSVPCDATKVGSSLATSVGPFGDTGYIYTGGWAGDGNNSLDIGLQYSAARQQLNPFYKWGGQNPVTFQTPFSCGDPLTVEWDEAPIATTVPVTYGTNFWVRDENTGQSLSVKIQFYDSSIQDWDAWMGGHQIAKIMTSIAQNVSSNDPTYDQGVNEDGYNFGVSNGNPEIHIFYDFVFDVGLMNVPAQVNQSVPYSWNVLQFPSVGPYTAGSSGYVLPGEAVGIFLDDRRTPTGLPTPTPAPTPIPIHTTDPCVRYPRNCM